MSKKISTKIEKYVNKRLNKLTGSMNTCGPHYESRIMVISGRYGFAAIKVTEAPGDGKSFVDYFKKLLTVELHQALRGDIATMTSRSTIGKLRVQMYDGINLKPSSCFDHEIHTNNVDYAKMQGIDLDEAAERQMDNYVDTTNGRKALALFKPDAKDKQLFKLYEQNKELERRIEAIKRDLEGSQKTYEKQKSDLEAKETELKHAYDKAAEDYETIQKLTKEVGELKIQLGKQTETIFQLKHPKSVKTMSVVAVPAKPNTSSLSPVVSDMNTKIDKLAEKVGNVETKEAEPEKPEGPNYTYPVELLRPKDNHEIELEDEYAFRRLDEIKKPYSLRDIFKIVHNEMYTEIHDNVYTLLGEIKNPIKTQIKKFPRQAYALAIALAAPASYVSAFRDRLIKDYRDGKFVPTRKNCMPENFENLLEGLYPEICRIQQILFHDTNRLSYVYKKYNKNGLYTFYMIGAKSYDTPDEVPTKTYVAIPKDEEPYEYIEFCRNEKLMYVLEHGQCMKKRDPLAAMHDCEYGPERIYSDYPRTLKDQIDAMIEASKKSIITLDTTDPEEVYKTQLRYYPIYPAYTDTFVNDPEK